jgi:hypothetical protein
VCTGTLVQCEQKVRERPGLMGGGWVGYRTSVIAARTLEDTIAIKNSLNPRRARRVTRQLPLHTYKTMVAIHYTRHTVLPLLSSTHRSYCY